MANWRDITTTKYTAATGGWEQGLRVTLQYDADSVTPTSMTIRFSTTVTTKYADGYYILWAPNTANEELFLAKPHGGNPTTSHSITLTKAYSASTYPIPKYWICHCGAVTPHGIGLVGVNNHLISYQTAYEQTFYNYFTNSRSGFKTEVAAFAYTVSSISNAVATDGTAPSMSIADQGNNTCIISGVLGSNGASNGIRYATLYYTTNGEWPDDGKSWTTSVPLAATSGGGYSKRIDIPSNCSVVKAIVYCTFTYNKTSTGNRSASVKYYAAPGAPGKPALTADSFKNNRLTIKQNWTYSWTAAKQANNNSPVKGYRIRLFKNGVNIPIKDSSGKQLSTGTASDPVYDRESTSNSITINPALHGFVAGDRAMLGIHSYARNGVGSQLFNGGGGGWETRVDSVGSTIENAGIVNVKVDGSWVEGQVWIKANNEWHEAETVNAKVNGVWEESQ